VQLVYLYVLLICQRCNAGQSCNGHRASSVCLRGHMVCCSGQ